MITDPWTPSDVPLAEMSLALAHAATLDGADLDADRCQELLTRAGGMADYVRELREAGQGSADTKVLVVVDQAEELVTMTSAAERQAFLEALSTSCTAPSPLRVVMTARTDMWDKVAAETGTFALSVAPTVLHVPPLSRTDLAEVISEPARRSHLTLEDGLVQRLVEDTGSGDALPLLAFTLARMAADAEDGRLTHAAYDAIGGVKGAIASRAGEVATAGGPRTGRGGDPAPGQPHRRDAAQAAGPRGRRPARSTEILDDLVDARLVVVNEVNDQQVYAPAHESLFSAWPPLVDLIEHRRRPRPARPARAPSCRLARGRRHQSGLLSGPRARPGSGLAAAQHRPGNADMAAYVDASAARSAAAGCSGRVSRRSSPRCDQPRRRPAGQLPRRPAPRRAARVGELSAIAEREIVHDPAAASAALLVASNRPGRRRPARLCRSLLPAPARDVYRAPGQATFFQLGVGGRRGRGDGRAMRLWSGTATRRRSAPSRRPAPRPSGRTAGCPSRPTTSTG